ncbi:MAG: cell division protein FtsI [Caulobacter sp.]|nr:cell division protein FtsI [Vitreoscilla sp.]
MSSLKLLVLAAAVVVLPGCSIISPVPLVELAKATGAVAVSAISTGPSHSKNTMYHEHKALDAVCVEYNPLTPDPDIAPALQAELRNHEIDSRIYEEGGAPPSCHFRVTYTAAIEWGTPPFASGYKSYIRDATLTLRDENGTVLSSSAYSLDGTFQMGKWSTSRSKLAPVVTALVTGFDH